MIVLGVDPGKTCTAFAVVDTAVHDKPVLLKSVRVGIGKDESLLSFLSRVYETTKELFDIYPIEIVGIECIVHSGLTQGDITQNHSEIRCAVKIGVYECVGRDAFVEHIGTEWIKLVGAKIVKGTKAKKAESVRRFEELFSLGRGRTIGCTADVAEAALVAVAMRRKVVVE